MGWRRRSERSGWFDDHVMIIAVDLTGGWIPEAHGMHYPDDSPAVVLRTMVNGGNSGAFFTADASNVHISSVLLA